MKTEVHRKPNCPYGKKAIELLKSKNIDFEDYVFQDETAEKNFKDKHSVKTTPQIFMNGERVGGFSDLAKKYGEDPKLETENSKKSYKPIVAIFSVSILLTIASQSTTIPETEVIMMIWMGFFLVLLAVQKLMDLSAFQKSFANYDLITKKVPVYGFVYPFAELVAGLGFISGYGLLYVAAIASVIGFFGSVSVIKAVYIDKRDLNCACAGGNTNLPLGFVSLSENLIMFLMGLWILIFM